jgi:hypothetical protein
MRSDHDFPVAAEEIAFNRFSHIKSAALKIVPRFFESSLYPKNRNFKSSAASRGQN